MQICWHLLKLFQYLLLFLKQDLRFWILHLLFYQYHLLLLLLKKHLLNNQYFQFPLNLYFRRYLKLYLNYFLIKKEDIFAIIPGFLPTSLPINFSTPISFLNVMLFRIILLFCLLCITVFGLFKSTLELKLKIRKGILFLYNGSIVLE